jgi:hypothetical protein
MKKKFYAFLVLAPILVTLLFQLNSCNAPKPAKCVITVRDSSGSKLLSGVHVELYANVTYNGQNYTADLKADGYTGSDGRIGFTFKNPCVMDIRATVSTCTVIPSQKKYCNGSGIVKCEEGKTAEKTVRIDH